MKKSKLAEQKQSNMARPTTKELRVAFLKALKEEYDIDAKQKESDEEAKQNLVGVFSILFEVDKRINPHLYKKENFLESEGIRF